MKVQRALPRAAEPLAAQPASPRRLDRMDPMRAPSKHLGLGPKSEGSWATSHLLDLLTQRGFAEVRAVNVPGRVVWFNFDLARELGIDVPEDGRMNDDLHRLLIEKLSYKVSPQPRDGEPTVTVYADRYGGTGTSHDGAGRAAFLPWLNLCVKGIGLTPLARVSDADFQHGHGGAPMREGFIEAIWGEVDSNLFSQGSTRILAVIDTGEFTEWNDGTKERRALIVRAGRQMRPAHLVTRLGEGSDFAYDAFVRATAESHDLVMSAKDGALPDIGATLRRVIERHALTCAEQFRWRLIHGAISTSNLELSGSQLDLATHTTQPRTARISVLGDECFYGEEHLDRAAELALVHRALQERLPVDVKKVSSPVDCKAEMQRAYGAQLQRQIAMAAGLKKAHAQALATTAAAELKEFSAVVQALAALHNPGVSLNADTAVVREASVVDVFGLLRDFPPHYFAAPNADHTRLIKRLLQPVAIGPQEQAMKRRVGQLATRFGKAYHALMERAVRTASVFYDDGPRGFVRTIKARAAFENRPIDALYRSTLNETLTRAIDAFARSGDASVFKGACDDVVDRSLRSVDGLLRQGRRRALPSGETVVQERDIGGIRYGIECAPNGDRRLRLDTALRGEVTSGYVLEALPGAPCLDARQLTALRYRFTTDEWQTWREVPMHVEGERLACEIPVLAGDIGRLEGVFHCTAEGEFWLKDATGNFSGFSYAVPDSRELEAASSVAER